MAKKKPRDENTINKNQHDKSMNGLNTNNEMARRA
jgi:hypothetical protein